MTLLSRFKNDTSRVRPVVIVSGLPRSGTSLMMQILEAGGLETISDHTRKADEDNPRGYYEFERVKKLRSGDDEWLDEAPGKAVKVISALLEYLPPKYAYKVIFMQRKMEEVLASQRQMLLRRGEAPDKVKDEVMAEMFDKHLAAVHAWLERQPNTQVLYMRYDELVSQPRENIDKVARFLDLPLKLDEMLRIPDKKLYRQKSQDKQN